MDDNVIDFKMTDAELLGRAFLLLDQAQSNFMEMKHPLGDTLFHMAHSISFYIEKYLLEENDIYKLPGPNFKDDK